MNGKRSDETKQPVGSVVPPTTISDAAVQAATSALEMRLRAYTTTPGQVGWGAGANEMVDVVLRSAVPYIEAGLRERLAAELEAAPAIPSDSLEDWRSIAARVARGTQEATK